MNLELVLDNLKKKGFKNTLLRRKLIDIFLSEQYPLSVPEILTILSQQNLTANKTSVYREIDFLLNQELIRQVDLRERGKKYEFDLKNHHHHLICIKCNRIEDFELDQELVATEAKILQSKQFYVLSHSLEFFGLCQQCK